MTNKFNFYEIVKICSKKQSLEKMNGCEGVISSMSQNQETKKWGYGVSIYADDGMVWSIKEGDLVPTGRRADPTDLYTGESVRVRVDPETGEGEIVEDDDV